MNSALYVDKTGYSSHGKIVPADLLALAAKWVLAILNIFKFSENQTLADLFLKFFAAHVFLIAKYYTCEAEHALLHIITLKMIFNQKIIPNLLLKG